MRNKLPQLRAARGWSQADLASLVKVSRQTINAIETERYEPSLAVAFDICEVFGLSVEEVFQRHARAKPASKST